MNIIKNKGFTLIELLVVIGIIGVLASFAAVAFSSTRMRTRDSQRVAYVKQINDALDLYYLHNGLYPTIITAGQTLAANGTVYLNPVPTNPAPKTDGGCVNQNFTYTVMPENKNYELRFCLGAATSTFSSGINVCSAGGVCNANGPDTVAGLLLWLRADSLDLKDGSVVTTWNDSSTNANSLSGSGSTRPVYKINVLNHKPVVRFDGTDDVLSFTTGLTTIRQTFFVVRWDSRVIDYAPILGDSSVWDFHGGVGNYIINSSYSSPYLLSGANAWNNGTLTTSWLITRDRTNFQLVEFQATGSNYVRANNLAQDRNIVGRNLNGDVAEVILYSTTLSTADRQKVERYLRDKYNLTIAGI
jgi:prepilin-type N-terminal cleavage/methylation domain-containing protein